MTTSGTDGSPGLSDADVALRNNTYRTFVDLGRAPAIEELATRTESDTNTIRDGWRRLHDAHAIVLLDDMETIRMASPFSGVTTRYRVLADDRWWHANCAWDAFGICAALHLDGTIETTCADCDEPITVHVTGGLADDNTLLFHCLVPANAWWNDITFT